MCPPIFEIYIWVRWYLDEVKDKYLFRQKASDQYAGRCASCLDQLKKEFSFSPPYFYFTEIFEIKKLDRNRQIHQFLETHLPRYTSISALKNNLKMCCFATIFFHHKKLTAMIHKKCPLRASPTFRYIPSDIMALTRISHPQKIMEDTPEFTGISPHIILMSEIEVLKR